MTSPWHMQGWAKYLANGWEFSPIYQIQNGLPYSLTTAGTPAGGLGSSVNGSGGATYIEAVGRDSFRMPKTYVIDARVSKRFDIRESYKLELATDFFNISNHPNATGVSNTGYIVGGTAAAPTLTYLSSTFGTVNNANSNFVYSPRQIQLSARFEF